MAALVARREGAGEWLADGVRAAAAGRAPELRRLALEVKGLEMVSFDPRANAGLGLGYAVAPIGPRFDIAEHDWDYDDNDPAWPHAFDRSRTLGLLRPIPMQELSPAKVRQFGRLYELWSALDALLVCVFAGAPTRLLSTRGRGRDRPCRDRLGDELLRGHAMGRPPGPAAADLQPSRGTHRRGRPAPRPLLRGPHRQRAARWRPGRPRRVRCGRRPALRGDGAGTRPACRPPRPSSSITSSGRRRPRRRTASKGAWRHDRGRRRSPCGSAGPASDVTPPRARERGDRRALHRGLRRAGPRRSSTTPGSVASATSTRLPSTATAPPSGASARHCGSGRATTSPLSTKVGRLVLPRDAVRTGRRRRPAGPRRSRGRVLRATSSDRRIVFDYSRDGVLRSVEASLSRLGLDRIDILFIHDPDEHWQTGHRRGLPGAPRPARAGASSARSGRA